MFALKLTTALILAIFIVGNNGGAVADTEPICVKNTIIGCPIVEGVQKVCFCARVCTDCCSCRCPEDYEEIADDPAKRCSKKATHLGESCQYTSSAWISCSKIPNAECVEMEDGSKECVCKPNRFPANNLKACIAVPTKLGQPCSNEIKCPTSIQHSTCLEVNAEGDFECGCSVGYFPDNSKTRCIPAPIKIDEECSEESMCTDIPASECVVGTGESTCQCLPKYLSNSDGTGCLATKLGMNCPRKTTCDLLPGAKCYGANEEDAICICPWNIPNLDLTKCLGFN